jgi:hypothetical protein
MNTPAPLKKINYDSRILITAFVVNSVIANRIFNKMHGQPFFDHPKRKSYENKKTFIKWQSTPVIPAHKFLLDHAISAMTTNNIPCIQAAEFTAQSETSGRYYAITFEDNGGGRYDNIHFHLLNPKERRLYVFTDTTSF